MRKPGLFLLLLFILTNASAQKATDYRKQQNYKEWVHIAPKFDDDFFKTEEAQRIGDNVLLYQQITGGWPKNIYMPAELTEQEISWFDENVGLVEASIGRMVPVQTEEMKAGT